MTEIEFNYEGEKLIIQGNLDEKLEEIIKRFTIKAQKSKGDLIFLYGGSLINEELTIKEQASEEDIKRNKICILVQDNTDIEYDDNDEINGNLIKSKYIICPECKENICLLINDYKITLYDCKNGHETKNILFKDFERTQYEDGSNIKCEECKTANRKISYNNIFYKCLECKKNLCPLCKSSHDKSHNIIEYNEKYFICESHNESYTWYCNDCKKDICLMCENEHNEHKLISYGKIMPNITDLKNKANDFNDKITGFKNNITKIISKLNDLMHNLDNYLEIFKDIINSFENKKRNYSILQNINEIIKYNELFIQDINKIIDEKNINNKIANMFNLYNKMVPEISVKKEIKENKSKNKISLEKQEKKGNEDIELLIKREGKNFENFNIKNLKKIISFTTNFKYDKCGTLELKDGRILYYHPDYHSGKENIFSVFNIKTKELTRLNFYDQINDIIQMDDCKLIIKTHNEIKIINIKENEIEIIKSISNYGNQLYKLSNKKILIRDYNNFYIYLYENNDLIAQKEIDISKKLKFSKSYNEINKICVINENEIAIAYREGGAIWGINALLAFYDIEKDKKIESFKFSDCSLKLGLINEKVLIFCENFKSHIINLKDNSIKKLISESISNCNLILPLNEKQFIIEQDYDIYQCELEGNKIKIITEKKKPYTRKLCSIYAKNGLIFKQEDETSKICVCLYGE